jgi:maltooligosyltrehalose trehalohydrolase
MMRGRPRLGATPLEPNRCQFFVWAPFAERVELHLLAPLERLVEMERFGNGYHRIVVEDVGPGALYVYRLDSDQEFPDPASRCQPEGVHGPSQVIGSSFAWNDEDWCGIRLRDFILYEIHVGSFTEEGTFDSVIPHLQRLRELGVNAIELMPVAQFPGERNWGYDGVFPFAVQSSYGGPDGLKRLVDSCHRNGFAVVLDVVYNHLGPEGNILGRFGPYFTDRYQTFWGPALNFDGPESDEVRRYFIDNTLSWLDEYHIDALRLDAVHVIADVSPRTFLEELALDVDERFARPRYLIPESAANDARLIRSRELGGYGLHAQWNDDFHHALRVVLTGDKKGYYEDYGELWQLEKAFREGFVYSGEYSRFRRRRHGSSSRDIPPERFVVFSQNHDQVGNRMRGGRLTESVCFERLKLAAAAVLLSPYIPLMFMGEEYGEKHPFPYFVSHSDTDLVQAVRRGRREEFASFDWGGEPPDPQDEKTFTSARLDHLLREKEPHGTLHRFYRELIRLHKEIGALTGRSRELMDVTNDPANAVITLRYWERNVSENQFAVVFHFDDRQTAATIALSQGRWWKRLDAQEERWRGPGSRLAASVFSEGKIPITLSPWGVLVYETRGASWTVAE